MAGTRRFSRLGRVGRGLIATSSALALLCAGDVASAETMLPEVVVQQPKPAPKPAARRTAAQRPAAAPATPAPVPPPDAATVLAEKNTTFDRARDAVILPKVGTNTYDIGREAIEALPQGSNTPVDKLLLQAPGVTQDSAASGQIHVRNEHGNVQYRINGILLPDGVSGFGQVLETGLIGNLELVTGAMPAQYGLRTAGLVDITTKSGAFDNGGSVSVYGGSRQTITPKFEYGGSVGQTQYFVTGRYFASNEGIENPTPSLDPLHDYTWQGKFFGYASTLLDENTRLSFIAGAALSKFQIPNNPGQPANFTGFTFNGSMVDGFDSALVNERQYERNYYNVVALQKKIDNVDMQVAYFSRYTTVHFTPDPVGDLVFNGIASDVYRGSLLNGIQGDTAIRLNDAHTLRAGMFVSGEQTNVENQSLLLATGTGPACGILSPSSNLVCSVDDKNSKLGWLVGTYIQDEWRITDQLTLNVGLRFDQMLQFVDANQLSPRVSLVYKPFAGTTFHAGYARYFTPPVQAIAAPTNVALFANTTGAPPSTQSSPVLPERSHYFDTGIDQQFGPGLKVGIDGYWKYATDLLDDGQFGQAYVLDGFNYAKGINYGIELKAKYENGKFRAYGNLAWARQMATQIVSNQFLFGQDELDFIKAHYIPTDHAQRWTASGGASYLWDGTRFSADMIYGSGLRSGFVNSSHVPPYTQVNAGISREFKPLEPGGKPFTLRFDVVNVFDTIYELRDGSGIGVFAPQFGPRRGYFVGLSQKL